jgi:ribonuclease HII
MSATKGSRRRSARAADSTDNYALFAAPTAPHPTAKSWCGEVEAALRVDGHTGPLIGMDEAGRGPLAGPVVAAAVVLPDGCTIVGLDDSKRLTAAARESLYHQITDQAVAYAVAIADVDEIDRDNILRASLAAMSRAWLGLCDEDASLASALVLVDGNQRAPLPAGTRQQTLIKGDARSTHVAAASILAKVMRDRMMCGYDAVFPEYGFAGHKGYPSAAHRDAIRKHGPCMIHRRSFRLLPEVEPERSP